MRVRNVLGSMPFVYSVAVPVFAAASFAGGWWDAAAQAITGDKRYFSGTANELPEMPIALSADKYIQCLTGDVPGPCRLFPLAKPKGPRYDK